MCGQKPLLRLLRRQAAGALGALVLAYAPVVFAEKSNEVRPIPTPIPNTLIRPGVFIVTPRLVYAHYADTLAVKDQNGNSIRGQSYQYAINSAGTAIEAQLGLTSWFGAVVGFEAYQKFGSITGPSVGDPSRQVQADVTGAAFKFALQADARLFSTAKDPESPQTGNIAMYAFTRMLGDSFSQDQKDPYFVTHFSEKSFEYRAGLVGHLYLIGGLYLAGFGGIDGVVFDGERKDQVIGGRTVTKSTSAGENPHPFVGGDFLWARQHSEDSIHEGLSAGATLDFSPEDTNGFGGKIFTVSVSYVLRFGGAKKAPAPVVEPVEKQPEPEPQVEKKEPIQEPIVVTPPPPDPEQVRKEKLKRCEELSKQLCTCTTKKIGQRIQACEAVKKAYKTAQQTTGEETKCVDQFEPKLSAICQ